MIKSMSTLEINLNSDDSFKDYDDFIIRNAYSEKKNDYKDECKNEEKFQL